MDRRWFIDFLDKSGEKKRRWIASKPSKNRSDRAKRELLKIQKEFYPDFDFTTISKIKSIIEKRDLRKKTKQTYFTDLHILANFLAENGLAINSLTKQNISDFQEFLKSRYVGKTVKNKINNLKSSFSSAVDSGLLTESPFQSLKGTYKLSESDFHTPYSEYERKLIEDHLKEHDFRLYLFTRFIFYTFTRPKELINLKISDIDLRTKTIKISSSVFKTGKTTVKPIIKPLFDLIVENSLLDYPSNFYLFGQNLKSGVNHAAVNLANNRHREILKELGLYGSGHSLYAWKHTGNIAAYLAGMDLKTIQAINGHSSIQTTEIYLRKLGLFLDQRAFDVVY